MAISVSNAQEQPPFSTSGWKDADQIARRCIQTKQQDLDSLTICLTQWTDDPFQQVRSIFSFTVHYLDFDHRAYKAGRRRINQSLVDILQRRKAVCLGYAQLFEAIAGRAGFPTTVVSGYAKTRLSEIPDLAKQNHAWNAIEIENKWYLLDASWTSTLAKEKDEAGILFGHSYFLSPPKLFVVNHLPGDPLWQLLSNPITPDEYRLAARQIVQTTADSSGWRISYVDSLANWKSQPHRLQKLGSAWRAYQFNPVTSNRRELGATLMDEEYYLGKEAERLETSGFSDSLVFIYQQMIELCELSAQLNTLFERQQENCAYTRINYAAALINRHQASEEGNKEFIQLAINQLEMAQQNLSGQTDNMMKDQALEQCRQYLEFARSLAKE